MADRLSLGEVGEHSFLNQLCARLRPRASAARGILLGPGDDCAVLDTKPWPLAVTTDALVSGVHFEPGWLSCAELGGRAAAVNLSDLAAMGARPAFMLIAVTAPPATPAADLEQLLDGFTARSEAEGAAVVGGNLSRARSLSVTVTALGWIDGPCLTRSGARPGDRLAVTGTLGGAAAAVASWLGGSEPAPELRERFVDPRPRVAAGRALARAGAHAAIDVSDGLLQDLGHLCSASGVGAVVERERLPRLAPVAALDAQGSDLAATGGEDYELLVALPPSSGAEIEQLAGDAGVPLTLIGECVAPSAGVKLIAADGSVYHTRAGGGFDHFRGPAPPRSSGG